MHLGKWFLLKKIILISKYNAPHARIKAQAMSDPDSLHATLQS